MILNYHLHDTTITEVNPCSNQLQLQDISRNIEQLTL